jgi:hypothetical protein
MEAVADTLEYAQRSRRATLGRTDRPWLRIGLETLFGLAVIAATGWAVWYQDGDASLIVYTTWCVVLVEAARHGPLPGLILAMLVCAGETLVLLTQTVDESALTYGGLLLPSMAGVALTIATGEFAQVWRQRNARALAQVRDLTALLQVERAHLASAADSIGVIERRIAEQPITAGMLHETAQRLESLDTPEILQATVELLVRCLPADSATVYLLENGRLVAAAHQPVDEPAADPAMVAEHELVRRVLSSGNVWTIHDVLPDHPPEMSMLMAAPLRGSDGAIIGVVTVEQMPFLSFTLSTIGVFEDVSRWASRRLAQAVGWQQQSAEVGAVLPFPQTTRRLWQEIERGRRFQRPLSLLVLRIDRLQPLIAEQIRRSLRQTDGLGQHARPGCLVCVLPETSAFEADVVGQRLLRTIQAGGHPAQVAYGLATLDDRNASTIGLLDEADGRLSPATGG